MESTKSIEDTIQVNAANEVVTELQPRSVQDRDIAKAKARQVMSRRKDKVKKLPAWRKTIVALTSLPIKVYLYGIPVIVGLAVVGHSIQKSTQIQPDVTTAAPVQMDLDQYFISFDPIMLTAASKGSDSDQIYKQKLGQAIIDYDTKLDARIDQNVYAMQLELANKMLAEALRQQSTGVIENNTYIQSVYDQATCPDQTLTQYKCVLEAMQASALREIIEGQLNSNYAKVSNGVFRLKAAKIAFSGVVPVVPYNWNATNVGIQKQIQAMRELIAKENSGNVVIKPAIQSPGNKPLQADPNTLGRDLTPVVNP